MTAPIDDWPTDPESLAEIAGNAGESAERRRRALSSLRPVIEECAEKIARGFAHRGNRQVADDLINESFSSVGAELSSYRQTHGSSFQAWARKVLDNRGIDLLRRQRTRDPLNRALTGQAKDVQDRLQEQPERPVVLSDGSRIAECFEGIRQCLDELDWPKPTSVDYQAVFLFDLRVRVALAYRHARGQEVREPGEITAWVAEHFPWLPQEEQLCMRDDLLTIRECWDAIGKHLDGPSTSLRAIYEVVDVLNDLFGSERAVSNAQWHQWTNRARSHALPQIGKTRWARLFSKLFLSKRPRQDSETAS